jgi:CubicO group peptidase (beta-lactamase class C family)
LPHSAPMKPLPFSPSWAKRYGRRTLLSGGLLILIELAIPQSAVAHTGIAVPELAAFDTALSAILKKYEIPGAAVLIAKDGRPVYSRGFDVADVETGETVQPDSLFRVASVSKPLTTVGVLKLVEDGKASLDTRVLAFIGRTASADVRWNDITVRHLLEHSGGMDLEYWGFEPSFPDRATLDALGGKLPPRRDDVLNYALANLPLASAPGAKHAYSNIGYMFLTEVIEKASGTVYSRSGLSGTLVGASSERCRPSQLTPSGA